jgi:hypothetical protein
MIDTMKELLRLIFVLLLFSLLVSCWSNNRATYTGPPPRTSPLDTTGADPYYWAPLPGTLYVEFAVAEDKDSCPVRIELHNTGTRLVRVIIDSVFASGEYKLRWDRLDSAGVLISPALYYYQYSICDSVYTYRMDFRHHIK